MTPQQKSACRIVILSTVAGYINAIGYIELGGVFVAAMTGNTSRLGVTMAGGGPSGAMVAVLVPLLFFLGAVGASVLRRCLRSFTQEWLWVAAILVVSQALRTMQPGGISPQWGVMLLAVAMAMQGATLAKFSGVAVQTIVITSNLIRFADNLVAWMWGMKDGKFALPLTALFPALSWIGCLAGAVLSVPARHVPEFCLVFPVPLLIGVALLTPSDPAEA